MKKIFFLTMVTILVNNPAFATTQGYELLNAHESIEQACIEAEKEAITLLGHECSMSFSYEAKDIKSIACRKISENLVQAIVDGRCVYPF